MRKNGRDSSCDDLKMINKNSIDQDLPGSASATCCTGNESIQLRIKKMGPICKIRKIFVVDICNKSSMEEDIDLDKRLVQEICSDQNECMWLSSAGPSPSLFFRDYQLSSSLHLSVDQWLSTLADSYLYLDQVINPEEENRSALVTNDKDASDFSITNSDSVRFSLSQCGEVLSSSDKSLTPCSTIFDFDRSTSTTSSTSFLTDLDRTSFLVSLVNLDSEDSELISDTEPEIDCLSPDFPSPSCRSSAYTSSDSVDLENFDTDEPIFWPSEWKHDWNPEETWKCFSMSPRKYDTALVKPAQSTISKPTKSKLRVPSLDSRKGCRRRLDFGPAPTAASKILERKRRGNTKIKPANATTPSRLRKTRVKLEMEDDTKEGKHSEEVAFELAIESVIGLEEFDGHEGVESDFNEDVFCLD
ncbi:uncharacterized protein LOC126664736 [Mercurialis annua]|uniref:uncharacterized protein LOC126664736 n=1 Tax=Mercurialis annua TaxID=3986 RepID=UPI00215E603C|nr:uncharacterized protein LOC126664736 [Mercurialis annua]